MVRKTDTWLPERLPEDIDAERSLLATCCAPGANVSAAECSAFLHEEDFVHPAHKAVFVAMSKLLAAQLEINSLTLKDQLEQDGTLNKVGGYPGLVDLLAGEDVERPMVLARVIKRKAHLRNLVHLGAGLVRQAATEEEEPQRLVDSTAAKLFNIGVNDSGQHGLKHAKEIGEEAVRPILEGRTNGVLTGFSRVDSLINGFGPGNLVVLAARPGIGKTALALNWLLGSAMKHQNAGGFFSLEMSKEEVYLRLISAYGELNMMEIKKLGGLIPKSIQDQVAFARSMVEEMPLFISDQAAITVPAIMAEVAKQQARKQKLKWVMVDYLQLIGSPEGSRGARNNESVRIGEISRGLKLMAKEFGIPVIVLSQLNREVEHRQGGRPQLSDLRDSGAIEQDADLVAFIHRKMTPTAVGEEPDRTAELIIAKHRNGDLGTIPLVFRGEFQTYVERSFETAPYGGGN